MSDQINGALAYLATPYEKYERGIHMAHVDAAKLAALLLRTGVQLFSPIAHGHSIAVNGRLGPHDMSIWGPLNARLMDACDCLIVAHMDGWEQSSGLKEEIRYFESVGKPIYDLEPATMVMTRRKRSQERIPENQEATGGA